MPSPRVEGFVLAALCRGESATVAAKHLPTTLAASVQELALALEAMERTAKDGWMRRVLANRAAIGQGAFALPARARALLATEVPRERGRRWLDGAPPPRRGYRPDPRLKRLLRALASQPRDADAEELEHAEGLKQALRCRARSERPGWLALERELGPSDRAQLEARDARPSSDALDLDLLDEFAHLAAEHGVSGERLRFFGALGLGAREGASTGGDERSRAWRRAGSEIAQLFEDAWLE